MELIQNKGIKLLTIFSTLLCVSSSNVGFAKESTFKKIEKKVDKEVVKEKFHEGIDAINQKKAHEAVDKVADYFDTEKIKEAIDEIAAYFDKDKIKEFIDYTAEHLDKDKIKEMIDLLADALDREKIKAVIDEVIASLNIDKERIKESFDESVDKVAASLEDATSYLEGQLKTAGNNKGAIDAALKNQNWKKWLASSASYGPATLKNLRFSETGKPIAILKRGEKIEGDVECCFDRSQCSSLSLYRVVLGIKNRGGQTTIFNHFGIRAGQETDHFTLTAPRERGVYQVGFRVVEAAREGTAIKSWDELDRNEQHEPPTIGLLIVI